MSIVLRRSAPLLAVLVACAPLEPIPENACGNQVLERDRGEDCDTFAAAGDVAPKGVVLTCGAPNEARACLYTCDRAVTAGCPVGWACGTDAVCRKPALAFSAGTPTTMSVRPEEVAFADFDGNALHDLAFFSGDALVIRYATGGGGFGPELLDALGSAGVGRSFGFGAAIGAVDGDTIADLVAPTPGGALVLRGSATQILQPVPYPAVVMPVPRTTYQLPTLAAVRAPGALAETVVFLAYRGRETLIFPSAEGMLRPLEGARLPAPALDTSMSVGRVARLVAVADLDGDGGSELAVGYSGHALIALASARVGTSTGVPDIVALPTRSVELPSPLGDVLVLADFDADGDADLIAEVVTPGGRPRVVVARYDAAAGAFAAPEPVVVPALAAMFDAGVLAIGDVNFDRRADFVVAGLPDREGVMVGSVVVSTATAGTYRSAPIAGEILGEAVLGDFNRDGAPDVAATGLVTPGIGIYLGSGLGIFNPSRVETTAFVHTLRVGDFDGDYVGDLMFLEESQGVLDAASIAVGSETVRLQVAFGRSQGAPGAPVSMGDVPRPRSLIPANFIDFDLVSDVAMLTSDDDGALDVPRYAYYAFRGASDRRVRATLGIAGPGRPIAGVWLGNFDAQDGTDLVAFAQPLSGPLDPLLTNVRPLWGLTGTDLRASASEAGHPIVAAGCDHVLRDTNNLKRGFVAQLALATEGEAGARRDLLVRFGASSEASLGAGMLELSALDVQLERTSASCADETTPTHGLGEVTVARLVDADGDQRDDLLLVQDGVDAAQGTNGITIRWSARLRAGRRGLVHDDVVVVAGPASDPVVDVALTDLDADGLADLVAATYGGVYVARQVAPRTFAAFVPVDGGALPGGVGGGGGMPAAERAVGPMPQLVGQVRIFAEDFDGDRLADVLVIRDRTVQPYRGLPVPPGGGRLIDEKQQRVEEEGP